MKNDLTDQIKESKIKKFTCKKETTLFVFGSIVLVGFFVGALRGDFNGISILIYIILMFVVVFFSGFIWMIKYDEKGFTFIGKGRKSIEYKDIQSVTHYQVIPAYRHTRAVDEFIIKYTSNAGTFDEDGISKLKIQNYPDKGSRDFFSYMRERNPNIVFSYQKANGEGVENLEFDFFPIDTSEEKTLQ